MTDAELIRVGARVMEAESDALLTNASRLHTTNFLEAVYLLSSCQGHVVLSGVGKSGIIAKKISATLASIGTPSTFIHPVDALHGDLGTVTRVDVVVLVSKSGETSELLALLPELQRVGTPVIAITCAHGSTLSRRSALSIDLRITREACPLNLAPMTSSTLSLALGDAIAAAVMQLKGATTQDFLRNHPSGSIGGTRTSSDL